MEKLRKTYNNLMKPKPCRKCGEVKEKRQGLKGKFCTCKLELTEEFIKLTLKKENRLKSPREIQVDAIPFQSSSQPSNETFVRTGVRRSNRNKVKRNDTKRKGRFNVTPKYNLSEYPSQGKMVIFAMENFKGFPRRNGTRKDIEALEGMARFINVTPEVHLDLTAEEVKDEIEKLQKTDFSGHAMLWVVILSHGVNGKVFASDEEKITVEEFWHPFRSDTCPTLAGKPKIFLFQACRLTPSESTLELDEIKSHPGTDFLFIQSTVKDNPAFRNPIRGSIFIQEFVESVLDHAHNKMMSEILAIAKDRTIEELNNLDMEEGEMSLQIPEHTSTMPKVLYFTVQSPDD